ncbi:MAG: argininosuccinate synthase [Caldisericaceae bacterium]|nr:argininosuccinate synthase [Caldisericaceae bacterium]
MNKKVVLAFSGGLDTTYCAKYLAEEKGLDVYTITVNTGGFSEKEVQDLETKAAALGVLEHKTVNIEQQFYQQGIRYLIYGNVLRNGTYPLSVSAERVFQVMAIADYVQKIDARYVAHGSTGAGNDQIRFDLIFHVLSPEVEILTPVRDQKLTREQEIAYLKKFGLDLEWQTAQYSINQGLWGTSVGGKETLTSHQALPQEAFPTAVTAKEPLDITLEFEKGELVGFNGQSFAHPLQAIKALNALVAPYGIGRDIHVGDTIIGIKGRVGFEAAGPMLILKAHQLLEKHVLTKWQIYWKDQIANWYGMMLHEGQYLDPVMRDMEAFLQNSQQHVTGRVFAKVFPYRFELQGIESPFDLMDPEVASYGEQNHLWNGNDARGFAKILAVQNKIFHQIQKKSGGAENG